MSVNISNVVNVALIPEGQLAARDNMNVVALITSETTGPLNSANRFALYSDIQSVAADWGTKSKAYDFATTFFGTQPNPITAGGVLVIGYWRAAAETVAASAAVLRGAQLSEAALIPLLQEIDDGEILLSVDDTPDTITGLDFRTATTLEEVVALIDGELSSGTATLVDGRIVITSGTTGATSEITFVTDPGGAGTYVGQLLGLAAGTGATITQGAASGTLTAESMEDAAIALKAAVNFKGAAFVDQPTNQDVADLAAWAQANSVLLYDVFTGSTPLTVDIANPVWAVKLARQTNYRMLYSKSGNRRLAAAYMARAHTVNFNAENSALTMNLKELAVAAEDYSQTEIAAAKRVGLDLYTTIKDVGVVLTSGANDFVDNRYNIIAFIDAVQTDMFNLLKQTGTKIPQTQRGVNQLIDQGEKTTRGFVRAGVFAPGKWSSPDFFGDRAVFERNIEEFGFYWLAGRLADQPQQDRQDRKSPVLQCAVKNAGAVHSVDIIINFNL